MEGWTRCLASLRGKTAILWLCCALFYLAAGKTAQILSNIVVLLVDNSSSRLMEFIGVNESIPH